MYQKLGQVTLKNGERVEAGVVSGPDLEWAPVVEKLLLHKGEVGNWQNSQFVRNEVGIDTFFYILHREGVAFSNILTSELKGAGILGHVWTLPEDRRKSACSKLMELQMAHFQSRGGKALFLKTDFDTAPFHIYRKFGFEAVEAQSGHMDFYAIDKTSFEAEYFAKDAAEIRALGWRHWPASAALFMSDFPGIVRCAPIGLFGRYLTENLILPFVKQNEEQKSGSADSQIRVLQTQKTSAVTGMAAWNWHPLWPDVCVVDVFCHPNFWEYAPKLLVSLKLPKAARYVAYGDFQCPEKFSALEKAGFQRKSILKQFVAVDAAKRAFTDVLTFEKD